MTVLIISVHGQGPQASDAHPQNPAALVQWIRAKVGGAPRPLAISADHIMWTRATPRGAANALATALARISHIIVAPEDIVGVAVITGRRRDFPAPLTVEETRRVCRTIADACRASI